MTAIDLPNGIIIFHISDTTKLHRGANYLFLTSHTRDVGIAIQDVAKHHGGKQYIHDYNRAIPMKFDKALMYVMIQETTQWDLNNLDPVILTSYHPWDPDYINDAL